MSSSIFQVLIALFYVATWLFDWPTLRQKKKLEKAIYYTLAACVLGLYLASLLQLEVWLPTKWIAYNWSNWLHSKLTS
ncbi:hypothetical protein CIG75_01395 [Tumebacillus algifaecis]|uniref:Uncharacterized protein n=1 Tax=Tumebacillus algifaecis TaxID=1214604 RepID=A0A223CWP7_9BACL|nr:hypothetical protein [Tumebacillus algifaecis]ASS73758.1 hypothetical protein CIG75_01395 [Tumebacillus algifaecis]